jgi:hypothetical protein
MAVYIYLAAGCSVLGTLFTFLTLLVCQHYGIEIGKNVWVLAIPAFLTIIINITIVELYSRFKKKG